MAVKSVAELAEQVSKDPGLAEKMKADPAAALAAEAFKSDPWFYRLAIALLGLAILVVIIGGIVLSGVNVPEGQPQKEVPEWLQTLAGTIVGGLLGLFATPPQR